MRVVDLAVRMGLGVGDMLDVCRQHGIDVSLGISQLRDEDLNLLGTLFQMDLRTSASAPTTIAPPPATFSVPPAPIAPPPSAPVLPPPPAAFSAPPSAPATFSAAPPAACPASAPATARPELDRLRDLGFDIDAEISVLTGTVAATDPEDDESDEGSVWEDAPSFATLSGKTPGRRRSRRLMGARSRPDNGDGDLSGSIDERWIPQWLRKAVMVTIAVGLATLVMMKMGKSDPSEDPTEPPGEAATLVPGSCFDLAGTQRVSASCLDAHDGQVLAILPDDTDRDAPYPGADVLYADGALRCQSDPGVLAATSTAASAFVVDAVVPSAGGWQIGQRDVICQALASGPLPLSGSLTD